MNYLFHLHLAGDDPDLLTGGFAGDFIKGRLSEELSPGFRRGVELHRLTDSFAQRHEQFQRSRQRLSPQFGLYRGIMVDLFYDHFLALEWRAWHREPLERYLGRVRGIIEERSALLPAPLRELVPVIFEELIPSYDQPEGIARALARMSRRVTRSNPLAAGGRELELHYEGLREDFHRFMPKVMEYAAQYPSPPYPSPPCPSP